MPTRSASSPTITEQTKRFIESVESGEVVAVGDYAEWPRALPMVAIPKTRGGVLGGGLKNAKAMVTAVMSSPHIVMAELRGGMFFDDVSRISSTLQQKLMQHLVDVINNLSARQIRRSRLVCLNLGEFPNVSTETYENLNEALKKTHIGHIYYQENKHLTATKKATKEILMDNRRKVRYAEIMLDNRNLMRYMGCNAWYNRQEKHKGFTAMLEKILDHESTRARGRRCKQRCRKKRCRGTSRTGERCCLCTNHVSVYCHHHRDKTKKK